MSFHFINNNITYECNTAYINGLQNNNNTFVCNPKFRNIEHFATTDSSGNKSSSVVKDSSGNKVTTSSSTTKDTSGNKVTTSSSTTKDSSGNKVSTSSSTTKDSSGNKVTSSDSSGNKVSSSTTKDSSGNKVTSSDSSGNKVQTPKALTNQQILGLIKSESESIQSLMSNEERLIAIISEQLKNEINIKETAALRTAHNKEFLKQQAIENTKLAELKIKLNKLMLLQKNINKVTWNANDVYAPGDVVFSNKKAYIALPSLILPPEKNPSWQELSIGPIKSFDVKSPYSLGDLVVFNKKVYQAKSDIPANNALPEINNLWMLTIMDAPK